MKTLFTFLALLFFFTCAQAADVGYFVRPDCGTIPGPVANSALCLQTTTANGRTAGGLYVYRGGSWQEADAGTHIADTTAGHAASAIGFTPNGSIAATDVQAAIQEVRDEAALPDPLIIPGKTVATAPIEAGSIARLTDGGAIGALSIGDGTNATCAEAKSQKMFIITCPPYNATGNGTDDDTVAIQAAITAAGSGNRIVVPNGHYVISSTLLFENLTGIIFDGVSGSNAAVGTRFTWVGNATDPALRIFGTRDSSFSNFKIVASTAFPLHTAIRLETRTGSVSTNNHFKGIVIDGTTDAITKGITTVAGTGGDNNNDVHSFENINISNYLTAGISFEHSQSKAHTLLNVSLSGNRRGARGVATNQGAGAGGSFFAYNIRGGGHTTADFDIGDANDVIGIYGGNLENSNRLLAVAASGTNSFLITLQGIRWASNGLDVDMRAISNLSAGPFVMIGNTFDRWSPGQALEIYTDTATGGFTAVGNFIGSTLTNPFTGSQPTESFGNSINRDDAAGITALKNQINRNLGLGTTDPLDKIHLYSAGDSGVRVERTSNGAIGRYGPNYSGTYFAGDYGLVANSVQQLLVKTSGFLKFNIADSGIIPGATSFVFRNAANSATNLTITDAGIVTAPTINATTSFRFPRVTAFPGSPTAGDTVTIVDDSAIGACDSAAGSAETTCQWTGAVWVAIGDGSPTDTDTLDTVFDRGKTIDGANSLANAVRIGDGTTPWCIYTDSVLGPQLRPCTDANVRQLIPTNFTGGWYDEEGAADVMVVDPDALGAGTGTSTWATGQQIVASNLGVEFADSDTNPACAAGNYNIYADLSETKLKKCQNGTATDIEPPSVRVQDRDVAQADIVNTVTETAVYSYSVPGGTLSTNNGLSLTALGDYLNNTGTPATFDVRVKYGATTICSAQDTPSVSASRRGIEVHVELYAAGGTSAQRAKCQIIVTSAGAVSGVTDSSTAVWRPGYHTSVAIDSTASQTLQITLQHGTADAAISGRVDVAYLTKIQ